MKTIRDLAELRSRATPGPLYLECINGHSLEDDSWLIPGAVRGKYGDNALNFECDLPTAAFVEAAFKDLPDAADELERAQDALERVEAEAAPYLRMDSGLASALAELRSILSPGA